MALVADNLVAFGFTKETFQINVPSFPPTFRMHHGVDMIHRHTTSREDVVAQCTLKEVSNAPGNFVGVYAGVSFKLGAGAGGEF